MCLKMNLRRLIYLLILLCVGIGMKAQVKIFGKVLDNNSQPIEFATVRIAKTAIGATTGLDGSYSLTVAQSDTIEVIFTCIGYKERSQRLIKAEGEVNLTVKLTDITTELQGVTVTEYRKQTDGMQNLDAETLKLSSAVSGNGVENLISTMAGVTSKNEMSSQYSVRGGSYDENSVYINGIEVYRPLLISSGQQEGLSIINPNLVGNIQFYLFFRLSRLDIRGCPNIVRAGIALAIVVSVCVSALLFSMITPQPATRFLFEFPPVFILKI